MKTKRTVLLVIMAIFLISCTANMGNVPWNVSIKDWSPHQKANFFMKTWLAEKETYDSMNAMKDKPENLIKVLKVQRDVLENSRIPIRTYAKVINSGGTPDATMEQEIIKWIRQLQQQYIYS